MDGESEDRLRHELASYYDEVRNEIHRTVDCPHLVADCVQDTYCRALAAVSRGHRPRDVRAWLCAIARNVVRDHYRHLPASVDPCNEHADIDPDEAELVDAHEERDPTAESVAEAVELLLPLDRELLVGFYFEKKGCKALALELGIPRGTVRMRLFRARKRLRKRLGRSEEVPRD
jgi:RNA polymerase sigma-70 factor (ECF subfamily)